MLDEQRKHWTETSPEDFRYRVLSDFGVQVEKRLHETQRSQADLARLWGRTEGRVSQVLNDPSNLTVKSMVEIVRAIGLKLSVLAYSDDDSENLRGPIPPDVFLACWTSLGKPTDMSIFSSVSDLRHCFERTVVWTVEDREDADGQVPLPGVTREEEPETDGLEVAATGPPGTRRPLGTTCRSRPPTCCAVGGSP